MRIPIIAANWKMHKTGGEAAAYVPELAAQLEGKKAGEVVICPPAPVIGLIARPCKEHGIRLGAQNMHWENSGAFTGEVSPVLLNDLGVQYVIVGHSERRQLFGETDQQVCRKVKAAFANEMVPIICVGETMQQRQAKQTEDVVGEQVNAALSCLDPSHVRRTVIAYEPVWAIGSGLAATGEDANTVALFIRKLLGDRFSLKVARDVRIQYGGSVKPENIGDFMGQSDIDGALVGGASLEPAIFAALVNNGLGAATP